MSRRKKILISGFILFHWGCVLAWLFPNPSPPKAFLLGLRAPLPAPGEGPAIRPQGIVSSYLFHTAQWQDWAMFAPNPLQVNRYLSATLTFGDGTSEEFEFPRLSRMGVFEAWVEKRYRKLQQRLIDENARPFHEDVARWLVRGRSRHGNPIVRVALYAREFPIPRHDRPEARRGWTDYTRVLREEAVYASRLLCDYAVRPEDLAGGGPGAPR